MFEVQTELDGHVSGPEKTELLGGPQGLDPEWVVVEVDGEMAEDM